MSALDRLVSQDDDDDYDDTDRSESEGSGSGSESESSDSEESASEEEVEEPLEYEELEANKRFYKFINGREKKDMEPEEWAKVVRQYYRQPTTELERSVIKFICVTFFNFFNRNMSNTDMHSPSSHFLMYRVVKKFIQ
jgi:hypothetical protein